MCKAAFSQKKRHQLWIVPLASKACLIKRKQKCETMKVAWSAKCGHFHNDYAHTTCSAPIGGKPTKISPTKIKIATTGQRVRSSIMLSNSVSLKESSIPTYRDKEQSTNAPPLSDR